MEIPQINKTTEPSEERRKIVEEVFKKYHKDLIHQCEKKLFERNTESGFFSKNKRSDSEEIVAHMYETLLTGGISLDLNRSEPEIRGYLYKTLDNAISKNILTLSRKKRMPEGGVLSLEEILDGKEEEELDPKLRYYFGNDSKEKENIIKENDLYMLNKIEQALIMLGTRDKKKADIIKKRYKEGKSDIEIAKEYGDTRANIHLLRKTAEKIVQGIIEGSIKSAIDIRKREK